MSQTDTALLDVAEEPETNLQGAPKEIRGAKAEHVRYQKAIRALDRHVAKGKDGTFQLKVGSAKDAGVEAALFNELRLSLEIGNRSRKAGAESAAEESLDLSGFGDVLAEHSAPDNHVHYHWWGMQIYVNDQMTHQMVEGAQKSSAAIAAILVAFGITAPLAAAVGGALFLLAGLIWTVCAWGGHKGLVVHRTWAGHTWIWHQ